MTEVDETCEYQPSNIAFNPHFEDGYELPKKCGHTKSCCCNHKDKKL